MNVMSNAEKQILEKVRMVAASPRAFGVLSQGERIAVALVLDRHDLIKNTWGTMLEAVNRLGREWTEAALRIQRNGWQEDQTS
jgi:hypothetical protein